MAAGPRPGRRPRRRGRATTLGKSVSTAYNLLASLCDEGVAERLPGGLYHLAPSFRETVAEESDRHDLSGVVDDLLARTHKRAYLAVLRGNHLRVVLERGLQGMPKLPGHEPRDPRQRARAGARQGRARARAPPTRSSATSSAGLQRFTPDTITDPRRAARRAAARPPHRHRRPSARSSTATSAASPRRVLDEQRRFLGAVGISMSVRAFDAEREALEETLRDVVGFQASADRRDSS